MQTNSQELEQFISSGARIVVDAYAEWCAPCKMMKPIFEKVANQNTTETKMFTLDVEKNSEFATKYGVRSIPTILVFENGNVISTRVGMQSENEIKKMLK